MALFIPDPLHNLIPLASLELEELQAELRYHRNAIAQNDCANAMEYQLQATVNVRQLAVGMIQNDSDITAAKQREQAPHMDIQGDEASVFHSISLAFPGAIAREQNKFTAMERARAIEREIKRREPYTSPISDVTPAMRLPTPSANPFAEAVSRMLTFDGGNLNAEGNAVGIYMSAAAAALVPAANTAPKKAPKARKGKWTKSSNKSSTKSGFAKDSTSGCMQWDDLFDNEF